MHPTPKEMASVSDVTVMDTPASLNVSTVRSTRDIRSDVILQADSSMNTLSTPIAESAHLDRFTSTIVPSLSFVSRADVRRLSAR